jgi:hypothetical protein
MRFYAVDPQEQTSSPYLFCGNSPFMFVDPDGEFFLLAVAAVLGGSFAKNPAGQLAFSTVSGGVAAELAGGNFARGAASSLMVGFLNHIQHSVSSWASAVYAVGGKYGPNTCGLAVLISILEDSCVGFNKEKLVNKYKYAKLTGLEVAKILKKEFNMIVGRVKSVDEFLDWANKYSPNCAFIMGSDPLSYDYFMGYHPGIPHTTRINSASKTNHGSLKISVMDPGRNGRTIHSVISMIDHDFSLESAPS